MSQNGMALPTAASNPLRTSVHMFDRTNNHLVVQYA
eukprot:CAMPEP_0195036122 /NCGR_PEP_ID=MMETSP0326_2-20130528/71770_1 /TAXON_ID=2866 ORGANISM="Crypthecodinium cohnii, Strain Seligo" /NCGR_SAMPLE_ID=MMETSP0326_2 /ASSEMBLY_ACC=CAM_ASM_000348 /LENGTH=35 /DNA_ID= /DNA_START= /DNA_END= /DNA_ORIENTATION=